MKILYVSQYFPPEIGAPSARVSELARHWVRMGHQVEVLTGFPNHPTGKVPAEYRRKLWRLTCREDLAGVQVRRTWLLPFANRKPWERILNYTSFCLSACVTGTFLDRPDVIIATSPQLLVALAGWWLRVVHGVPFIFEVRDIWPESLTGVGLGSEQSLLHRALGAIASFLYRRSDHIVVVTPAFRDYLAEKWSVPLEKMSVVENGVELELFSPEGDRHPLGDAPELRGKFIVSYIGTLGMAHGLETVLQAAAQLQQRAPDVAFLLIGEGSEKERLVAMANALGLSNVHFLPQQPKGAIPGLIRASDVCLVLLKNAEIFKTVLPTKLLEFLACGRPVVLGVNGHARDILQQAGGGIAIDPEDAFSLVSAISRLRDNPELRRRMGQQGRAYVSRNFSRQTTARKYGELLQRLRRDKTSAQRAKGVTAG